MIEGFFQVIRDFNIKYYYFPDIGDNKSDVAFGVVTVGDYHMDLQQDQVKEILERLPVGKDQARIAIMAYNVFSQRLHSFSDEPNATYIIDKVNALDTILTSVDILPVLEDANKLFANEDEVRTSSNRIFYLFIVTKLSVAAAEKILSLQKKGVKVVIFIVNNQLNLKEDILKYVGRDVDVFSLPADNIDVRTITELHLKKG